MVKVLLFLLLQHQIVIAETLCDNEKQTLVTKGDCSALLDFYYSTNGDSWTDKTNWLSDKPISEWAGIRVVNSRVVHVSFEWNNMRGSIPESFGNLTALEYLNLPSNGITGSIPLSIGNLIVLKDLILFQNSLTGSIPASIGNLVKLDQLNFGSNQLSGTIPSSIGNLAQLRTLDLRANKLSGQIPSSIGSLSQLHYLYLFANNLSGSIPSSIGSISSLWSLNLSYNQLTGKIPTSLANLHGMQSLSLKNNQLRGYFTAGMLGPIVNQLQIQNNCLQGLAEDALKIFIERPVSYTYYPQNVCDSSDEEPEKDVDPRSPDENRDSDSLSSDSDIIEHQGNLE